MATTPTPQLLRKLKYASQASNPFINACKRALERIVAQPDVAQTQSQGDSFSQQHDEEDVELKEEELRAWREATEPLQKVLPEDTIYFIPYTLINNAQDSTSATALLAQINAINLALTLEMFLPASTRTKYPMLTTQIPLIDASSKVDGASMVASSQTDERSYPSSSFGISQSQSQSQSSLTQEQKIERLTLPLAELKSVYLRLCAGRKEKHVLYVLRRVILEICCISIITSTKARSLKTFKPQDLLDTFKVAFLKDPALVGSEVDGGVFASKEVQEKACKLWEKWAGDVMHRFQSPLNAQNAYTWEALADTLLTDLLRHVLPPVLERLEMEGKKKVSFPAPVATTSNINDTHTRPAATTGTQAGGKNNTKPPAKATAVPPSPPAQPKGSVDSRFFMAHKKKTTTKPATTISKSSTTIPNPVPKTLPSIIAPKTLPTLNQPTNVEEDEFGPRLVNTVNKGRVVLPDRDRTVIHAPGSAVHEFDMMDYVQDFGGDDAGFDNNDGGGSAPVDNEQEEEGTPFAVAVARFGQEPYVPAPKFGFTRVPENFRFNAPQRNAAKAVMTPSPESEKGSSYVPPNGARNVRGQDADTEAGKSTLSRMKAAVVSSDRGKGRSTSVDLAAEDPEDALSGTKQGRKRKQGTDEEDEEYVEEPRVKKRKGRNGKVMPPPGRVPSKPTGTAGRPSVASTTTTLVNPPPYAARHSSASSNTLFNPSDMAGPSSAGGTGAVRAAPPVIRHSVVMADTDSSDDEGPFRRRKTANSTAAATSKTAPLPASTPAPPAKSTSTTGKATPAKNTSTIVAAPMQSKPRQPVPLPISDELMKSSKERLSRIKEINEKNRRLYAALLGEEEEDPEATEDSGNDNEEELRKFRERREREARGELRGPEIGDLEKSRSKLEDLKKRSKAVEKLPVRRRAKKAAKVKDVAGSSGEEDELDEEEEEEERVDVPRPRGRPRKTPTASAQKRERGPREYKYAVGGNEHGRKKWTEDEDKTLLFALEATFYEGDLLRPWQKIRDQHGPDGTDTNELAGRNVMQIKDRARAIAEKMVREGTERPDYLAWIKVSQKRLTTRK